MTTAVERPRPDARFFEDQEPTERVLDRFEDDVWVTKLLNQAEDMAVAGRLLEAVDLLELVITMEPKNDVARARLHALASRLVKNRPTRGDETVRLGL